MHKMPLSSFTEPIQTFLSQVGKDGAVIVEDVQNGIKYRVTSYQEPTPEQRQQAWESIQRMQQDVEVSMLEHGVTEQELDDLLKEDD